MEFTRAESPVEVSHPIEQSIRMLQEGMSYVHEELETLATRINPILSESKVPLNTQSFDAIGSSGIATILSEIHQSIRHAVNRMSELSNRVEL